MFDFTLEDDLENTLKKCGIYKITCTANSKFYVGCTYSGFKNRLLTHRSTLKNNKHFSYYMQNSFNKYGIDIFKIEILEIIDKNDVELIFKREDYWIDLLKPHFNSSANCQITTSSEDKDQVEKRLNVKNTSGYHNVSSLKTGLFKVTIRRYEVGTYKTIDQAIYARDQFLLNPIYREPKPAPRSGEKYVIADRGKGWKVKVQGKYIGYFKHLEDAIKARDEFLTLPVEQQVPKISRSSNTGEKNISYRESKNRYRVTIGYKEITNSCKTLEEAILVRDNYIAAQKESTDCGSNSATTSTTCSSTYNPKSSSDTQSS